MALASLLRRPPAPSPADALERRGDALIAEGLRWADNGDEAAAHALICSAQRAYADAAALRHP